MEQQTSYLGTEEMPLVPPTSDEKTMALLSHALTLGTSFVAPLILYFVKKDESSFIAAHAKESLNFIITLFIVFFAALFIELVIGLIFSPLAFILSFGIRIAFLLGIILIINATIKASQGKLYRYPVAIRLIK
jgi:uncharacterized Tic20 family protein